MRELTATIEQSVLADGDAGRGEAAAAAADLWALRAQLDAEPPLRPAERADLFAALSEALRAMHAAENVAVAELAAARKRVAAG